MQHPNNYSLIERTAGSDDLAAGGFTRIEPQSAGDASAAYWDTRSGNLSGLVVMLRKRGKLIFGTCAAVFLIAA
ncbi:MAG TPA: hypothetical protein PLP17_12675, partial [Oligoflexia bacterium]|nr:hypothetical protein [Oligoflexia bacterium]